MRYLLLVLLLTGCGDVFGPPALQIADSTPLVDAPRFDKLWTYLQNCSGIRTFLPAPSVYLTPLETMQYASEPQAGGMYFTEGRRVFLGIVRRNDDRLVLHEFMHALSGHHTHPPVYFLGACGDLLHTNTQPPLVLTERVP
jgi:hypothetical protein